MARMVDSNVTTLTWVDEEGFADIAAPTVLELEAGTDITCAVVTGYELGMTDSDTTDEKSVCDVGNVTTYTNANYSGVFTFFRSDDPVATTGNDGVYNAAYDLFITRGVRGYMVRRIGKAHDAAWEAGDEVEIYLFSSDYPQYSSGQGEDHTKFIVNFGQQGEFALRAVVAA